MDVKIADRLNKAAVERDLLLGLTQRGRSRARIISVDLAAWERNLPSVVREMGCALREQHRRLRPRNDRDEHSGRPGWTYSGDCRHHCRIGVVIIMARDDGWIGEPFRRIEREARFCKRKKLGAGEKAIGPRRAASHGTFINAFIQLHYSAPPR